MPKLTEPTVAKITVPPGKRDVLIFDDTLPGFGVRAFSSGKRSYFVKYTVGTQQRKLSLGAAVPGVLVEMRRKASDILARARIGQDVAGEKQAARAKKTASMGELVPRFLQARREELRRSTYSEWDRYLSRYWQPLHALCPEAVSRLAIVTQLDVIAAEHGKVSADRARTALSAFFAWLIDRSYLDKSPVVRIKRCGKNGSRERVLSEAELATIWRCVDGESDYGHIIRLLILTAQRREEIAGLRWSEINLDKRQIDLPGARTKNKRPHIVPLSTAAMAIIEATPRRMGRDLLFGDGEGSYSCWSQSKKRLDSRLAAYVHKQALERGDAPEMAKFARWTLHDIRRSGVTHLAENGFALPHVIEMLVNHQSGHKSGVAGVYDKAKYRRERRQALELWGAHVTKLVESGTK
jgi:integrase